MEIKMYQDDLPDDLNLGDLVAVDCEMMGLNPIRDRLCLVQLSSGDGNAHLVQIRKDHYNAPNLVKLLSDPKVTKIFHFGRADIATLWTYLDVVTAPIYCTKVASKLARTFSPHHSLKTLCKEMLDIEVGKQMGSSDWGADEISEKQKNYAAEDVLYLHDIKKELDKILEREGRADFAKSCFNFIPTRALLDVAGWAEEDIFAHH